VDTEPAENHGATPIECEDAASRVHRA
jgi:hypothetical protein